MSNPVAEQWSELNKTALDQWIKLSQLSIENAERLSNVSINAAKESLEEQVKHLQSLPHVRDGQGWARWSQKTAEAQLDSFFGYTRKLYEAAATTQDEVGRVIEDGVQQYQKNVNAWVENVSKSAPAGSEFAINALKNGISATNTAIDGLNKATRQAAAVADAGVKAAVNATINTVKQAHNQASAAQQQAVQTVANTAAAAVHNVTQSQQQSNKKAAN